MTESASGALVSVVIPTRDRAALLERAIRSALAQTWPTLEVVVVDDGSADATPDLLRELAHADARVRPVQLSPSRGAAAARNAGIAAARGEFVAFLDDDDEWLPSKLERVLPAFADPRVGVAYAPYILVPVTGAERVVGRVDLDVPRARLAMLRGGVIDTSAAVARKSLLQRVGGFDESLPRLQDWDLWLRLAPLTGFRLVPEPLHRSPVTPGGISGRRDALLTACEILERKYGSADVASDERVELLAMLGHKLFSDGFTREGRRLLNRAFRMRPFSGRRLASCTLAALGEGVYRSASALHARFVEARRERASTAPPA